MAKETKQDRAVRAMFDQVNEHIHELKILDDNLDTRESDIEKWCASFLKSCLAYAPSSGYVIRAQDTKGNMRPDLVVLKNEKPLFLVEVKKAGFDFDKSDFRSGKIQLSTYLNAAGGVRYGMLTNGNEWRLYDFSTPQYGGIEIARFELKDAESNSYLFNKRGIEENCYEMMDFHELSFNDKVWDDLAKEATAFSPESLSKAILSSDAIKYIARSIRGEHDYKANPEVLTDKVYSLLELGLNDAIAGWNETKVAEMQKYVKSQKRALRKTKRATKRSAGSATSTQDEAAEVEVAAVGESSD